jgi:hypothetical protein
MNGADSLARPKEPENKTDAKALIDPISEIPPREGAKTGASCKKPPGAGGSLRSKMAELRMIEEDPDEEVSRHSSKVASFDQKPPPIASKEDIPETQVTPLYTHSTPKTP